MPRKCSCKSSPSPLPRRMTVVGWWVALLVAIPASGALAQEPLPQTHTVRKGDSAEALSAPSKVAAGAAGTKGKEGFDDFPEALDTEDDDLPF